MRGLQSFCVAGAVALLVLGGSASATTLDCRKYLMGGAGDVKRSVTAEDLATLTDIGSNGGMDRARALSVSPDGRLLAFQVRRADPEQNEYCTGIIVLSLTANAGPRLIDVGADPVRLRYNFRGKAGFPTGVMATIEPRWTPDGKAVLFLKRSRGTTQVWRAMIDGSGSAAITASQDDIVDFWIVDGGELLAYRTQPGLKAGEAAIDEEGKRGFHYDGRFSPMTESRPFVPAPVAEQTYTIPLLPSERAIAPMPTRQRIVNPDQGRVVRRRDGETARLVSGGDGSPLAVTLEIQRPDGSMLMCRSSICDRHISGLWWSANGRLRFYRREGWGGEATAVYEWAPSSDQPKRIYRTQDLLTNCAPVDDDVICLRESAQRPRYVTRISFRRGAETVLFDPNRGFSSLTLGRVQRLHWKNDQGLETFGDLVFPVGYERGRRYPLIVVQYESRGFLRGGTGDEYPIQLFANNGYAVLSFNRPPDIGLYRDPKTIADVERKDLEDFADRRSVQSALERGVKLIIERGIADPERIGITGLSDGASSVQFALLNSKMFHVAEMSSCCWDSSLAWQVGPRAMRDFSAMGYPGVMSDSDPFWDRISIAKRAKDINVPILLQLPDSEYLGALTAYTRLRELRAPVDLYVFPLETHIKWQPAHRIAIYRRSLAWFDFWLKNVSPKNVPVAELEHWEALRQDQASRSGQDVANDRSRLPYQ